VSPAVRPRRTARTGCNFTRSFTSPKRPCVSVGKVVGVTIVGSRAVVALTAAALALLGLTARADAASYAKGLDVSNWQGTIDWLQVADDDYTFAFAKATESTSFTDVTYALNRSGTKALGIRLGAYHFARPSGTGDAAIVANAIAEADHFVDVAQPRSGDLPPVLDLETNGGLAPAALARWTQAWLDEVAARTGVQPLIYASPSFWKNRLGDTTQFAENGNGLWVAHWTKAAAPQVPASSWGGHNWMFWQWTNCETIPGITHCTDADRANASDPSPFALAAFPTGPPASSSPPTMLGTARSGTRLTAVPGEWSGGKPVAFTYQWQSCDSAGAGCTSIAGATLPTYVAGATDVGHALKLAVTATGKAGSATAVSPASVAVGSGGSAATRLAALAPPQVSGSAVAGQTLSAAVGTWSGSPTSFALQWRRCDGFGSACVAVNGATGSSYALTPTDIGATISLLVTATNSSGSQSAAAPTTVVVAAAPIPPAVRGSLAAPAGAAGAVVTTDGRATATWQPGAVTAGTTVGLESIVAPPSLAGTALSLTAGGTQTTLPWPIDVAYASVPSGQVVGFSRDGRTWTAVPPLTSSTLQGAQLQGTYTTGAVMHVLTRQAGRIAVFTPGKWGDPSRVSPRAPVVRRVTPLRVTRLRDGTLQLITRLSTSSQAHVYAAVLPTNGRQPWILKQGSQLAIPLGAGSTRRAQALVLQSGSFPTRLRFAARTLPRRSLVRLLVTATDPWGRSGAFTISFRVP
jgi:GH25 family lysozyme M1 (1,4-beta-N-acetylmuramidase)